MAKMLRSWHYQNTRVDIVTSPLYVMTNTLGLIVAIFRRKLPLDVDDLRELRG